MWFDPTVVAMSSWNFELPAGGKFNSGKPMSGLEFDLKQARGMPGPGTYDIAAIDRWHNKIEGGRFNESKAKSFLGEVVHRASLLPGPGQYDIQNYKVDGGPSGGRFNMSNPKTEVEWAAYYGVSMPGPGSYDVLAIDRYLNKVTGGRFNESRSKTYVEWQIHRAKQIPGPGEYDAPRWPQPSTIGGASKPKPRNAAASRRKAKTLDLYRTGDYSKQLPIRRSDSIALSRRSTLAGSPSNIQQQHAVDAQNAAVMKAKRELERSQKEEAAFVAAGGQLGRGYSAGDLKAATLDSFKGIRSGESAGNPRTESDAFLRAKPVAAVRSDLHPAAWNSRVGQPPRPLAIWEAQFQRELEEKSAHLVSYDNTAEEMESLRKEQLLDRRTQDLVRLYTNKQKRIDIEQRVGTAFATTPAALMPIQRPKPETRARSATPRNPVSPPREREQLPDVAATNPFPLEKPITLSSMRRAKLEDASARTMRGGRTRSSPKRATIGAMYL